MSVKKWFRQGFEKSSACMSQQKGYRLQNQRDFSFTHPFLLASESKTGVRIHLSVRPPANVPRKGRECGGRKSLLQGAEEETGGEKQPNRFIR